MACLTSGVGMWCVVFEHVLLDGPIVPSLLTAGHEVLQQLSPSKFVTPKDALLRDWLRSRVAFVEAQRQQEFSTWDVSI